MAENKTEKATPKKRQEARAKGQVARSQDANGAIVLMAAVLGLSAFGPAMFQRMQEAALGVLDAEVVVVDNASSDDSADRAAAFDGVVVDRAGENLGYARGMNRALAGTDARALLALNPDTEPVPGSIERLVRVLDEEPRAAITVPSIEAPAKTTKTAIMIAAAPVITRAVFSRPNSIAAALSPSRS